MRPAALSLVCVGAGIAGIAGCGGSSGLSDKDYRAKADAICASVTAQRDRLSPASNIEDLRAAAQSTIAINLDALRRLKAIKPPGDLSAPHAEIVARLSDTLRLQQQAVKETNPASQTMQSINLRAGQARAALVAAAVRAKLPACERL